MPHLTICRHGLRPHGQPCTSCVKSDNDRRNRTPAHHARKQVSPAQRARVYSRDHHACVHCGKTTDLTIGHIEPLITALAQGKPHYTDDELQTECRSCNSRLGGGLSKGGRGFFAETKSTPRANRFFANFGVRTPQDAIS